jgi:hypothetical protein
MPDPATTKDDELIQRNFLLPNSTAERLRLISFERRVPQAVIMRYALALAFHEIDGDPKPELDF